MNGLKLLLATVLFAIGFCLAVPDVQAGRFFFPNTQRIVIRQPVQRFVVRQQLFVPQAVVAPLVVPAPQAIIVQQPAATLVVPQAFSSHAFFAY